MASQAAVLPKFTQTGFDLSQKARNTTKTVENGEDWYIPYNGPFEPPRDFPNRRKARDSWGDLLEPDDDEDTVLNDKELHLRYGVHIAHNDGGRIFEEERKSRRRDRSFSFTSGHTVSSGTIDPSRPSIGTNSRSTVSAGIRRIVPSYISMDALGRIGESPMPPRRSSQERNRKSLAGIFSLNTQSRKSSTTTSPSAAGFVRKPSFLQRSNLRVRHDDEIVHNRRDSPARSTSSTGHHAIPPAKDMDQQMMLEADPFSSVPTEMDYYNSYYSTLIHERRSERAPKHHQRHHHSPYLSEDLHPSTQPSLDQSSLNRQNSSSTNTAHPYALATPRNSVEGSLTSQLVPPSNPPQLKFTTSSQNPSSNDPSNFSLSRFAIPRTSKLKNSVSTPDLRNSAVLHDTVVETPVILNVNSKAETSSFVFPKAIDRLLSVETWCDALLFPRPRLKVGVVPTPAESGRVSSPPGSPIGPDLINSTGMQEIGIASRVLAHSRSLTDFNKPGGISSSYTYPHDPTPVSHEQDPQTSTAGAQSQSPQSKTFAQDDLALPTPVPSLAQYVLLRSRLLAETLTLYFISVLEQGQRLDNERRAWQLQAQGSFGNKHARTLSKTRSKSLTQQGRRRGHHTQTNMEYLAAQVCLGHQTLTPVLPTAELNTIFPNTKNVTSSRSAPHSHSNSLTKTSSKSSKPQSRNHSSNDSWSKSAVKMAKSTTAVICGFSQSEEEEDTVPRERDMRTASSLEGALRGDGTKIIRLADPVHIPVGRGLPVTPSSTRLTPSPSNSDQRVGIALGTPPPGDDDDPDDLSYHPSHPYAQGGLSFSVRDPRTRVDRGAEFAGPHPSIVVIPQISDALTRHKHRLPPHVLLHPYAQGSARDSYLEQNGLLAQYRSDDDTPRQMKMWAQLSPGVLREVLPGDLQYSPDIQQDNNLSPVSTSSHDLLHINSTFGVGETLANAGRFHRKGDGGVGPSDSDAYVAAAKPVFQADRDNQPQGTLPVYIYPTITEYNLAPSENPEALKKPSLTEQVISASPEQYSSPSLPDRTDSTFTTTGSTFTSTGSSPHLPPHRLGNGLESFQDLFYRPSNNSLQQTPCEAAYPDTPSPPRVSATGWDDHLHRHRTESGLTSLARQLSQEFELMALEQGRSSSHYSSIPSTRHQSSNTSRRPTDGSFQFIFEETSQSELVSEILDRPTIKAFHPSDSLPEDVESSRASSLIERTEEDNDDTGMLKPCLSMLYDLSDEL